MEKYRVLQQHYEKRLAEYGPNHKGMDWPDAEGLNIRFRVLTGVIKESGEDKPASLLDLGCGVGLMLDYLATTENVGRIEYHGADISTPMIQTARERHPREKFEVRDVLKEPFGNGSFDYVIMNGVLTEKQSMEQSEMIAFAQSMISAAFESASIGISFNVMSSHVDWKREDLFHWELDLLVEFLVKKCSRNIRIMMDYGLYEYAVYVYK